MVQILIGRGESVDFEQALKLQASAEFDEEMEQWKLNDKKFLPYGTDIPPELKEEFDEHVRDRFRISGTESYLSRIIPFHLNQNFDFAVRTSAWTNRLRFRQLGDILEAESNQIIVSEKHTLSEGDPNPAFSDYVVRFQFPLGAPNVASTKELEDLLTSDYMFPEVVTRNANSRSVAFQKSSGDVDVTLPVFLHVRGPVGDFYNHGRLGVSAAKGEAIYNLTYDYRDWLPDHDKPQLIPDSQEWLDRVTSETGYVALPTNPELLRTANIYFEPVSPSLAVGLQNDEAVDYELRTMWRAGHLRNAPPGTSLVDRLRKTASSFVKNRETTELITL